MSARRIIRSADLVRTAWKDGGGTTAEVVVSPEGAGFDDFDWRISMADVAADGPFSRFPGVDRTLILAEGRDLVLDVGGATHRLRRPGDHLSFPGDAVTAARLEAGPIRDINVMTRRGGVRHRVGALEPSASWVGPDIIAVVSLGDGVTVRVADDAAALSRLDTVVLERGHAGLTVTGPAVVIGFTTASPGDGSRRGPAIV